MSAIRFIRKRSITTELTAYAKERNAKPDNYLFTAPGGASVHPDTFTKRLKRLYARIGFPKASICIRFGTSM